ncbi:MAG: 30S ribosomal protein S4 [Methanobacteriota archaeon]
MKRQRKKYLRPSHPWEKDRMDAEDMVLSKYGLTRKTEIWRAQKLLKNFRVQARNLLAASGPQAEKETKQLITRLRGLGLVGDEATLDDVLGLSIDNLLERRLQTIVQRKGMAQTMKQARQMVTHGHIAIDGRRVNVPSYLVLRSEDAKIGYAAGKLFPSVKPEAPTAPELGKVSGEETVAVPEAPAAEDKVVEGEK